jgi:hypothetical protein
MGVNSTFGEIARDFSGLRLVIVADWLVHKKLNSSNIPHLDIIKVLILLGINAVMV